MYLLARGRLFLARHRWVRWAVVLALAGGAALSVAAAVHRVEAARRSWGTAHRVWVATGDLRPGDPLTVERRQLPEAAVPDAAVAEVRAGSVAQQHVGAGEVITAADVGRPGWVPPGEAAFTVPIDGAEVLSPGDAVAVYAAGEQLAEGTVVAVGEGWAEVAVPVDAAPVVSGAVATRAAVLARTSP